MILSPRWRKRCMVVLVIGSVGVTVDGAIQSAWSQEAQTSSAPHSASLAPTRTAPGVLSEPPQVSAAEIAWREAHMKRVNLPGPPLPEAPAATLAAGAPAPGTETGGPQPNVPGTFRFWRAWSNSPANAGSESAINEPSLGNAGRLIFETYNWYTALSTNGGVTWSFINPYTKFPAADGGFCCDQEALYDPSRDLMFWLLQYIKTPTGNRLRVAMARGETNLAAGSFYYYDLTTAFLGQGTGNWLDYPHLALSNNFLYLTVNVFNQSDVWVRTIIVRASLDQLRAGGTTTFTWWNTSNFTLTPVQGAREVMYLASHNSTTSLRIFSLADGSATLSSFDRAIPVWTSTPRGSATCTTPDGNNPCARLDHRINSGWYTRSASGGEIGFLWTVREGSGFPFPYVNSARFRESGLTYLNRPFIWNSSFAWFYAGVGVNDRGHVGIGSFTSGGGTYPRWWVGIDDDYNVAPPPWAMSTVYNSTDAPDADVWGDYLRVRPFHPSMLNFIGSGYRVTCGASSGCAWPSGVVFGRERDQGSWERWNLK
ncbi:MAG: hypothetical protein HYY11_04730 [Candidatus Methylomirabilis oxyfera]|nr:hypothetical protein [Candidatus Methylomirabilis oxyfera]